METWQREQRTPDEPARLERLGASTAWALLMTAELGRLAFTDQHGPTVEPFAFALDEGAIVVAAGARSGARAAVGQTVAFEVDEIDTAHRSGWSVVAVGTLHRAAPTTTARPEPWPGPEEERTLLALTVDHVGGRRLSRGGRRG